MRKAYKKSQQKSMCKKNQNKLVPSMHVNLDKACLQGDILKEMVT